MPRIQAAPMWSLGYFREPPPKYPRQHTTHAQVFWEEQMRSWLAERLGSDPYNIDVRSPQHIWSIARQLDGFGRRTEAMEWHKDGPMPQSNRYLGVWSNTLGTEIKKANSYARKIYQPEPCEFLLFDNDFFVHRPPTETTEEERQARWFVRLYTNGPLRRHPDILRCLLP